MGGTSPSHFLHRPLPSGPDGTCPGEPRACIPPSKRQLSRSPWNQASKGEKENAPLLLPLHHLAALLVPLELLVVEDVVDLERALEDLGTPQVVDGEDCAALVGVHDKGEPFGLLSRGVAREGDVDDFAVSGRGGRCAWGLARSKGGVEGVEEGLTGRRL